MKFTYTFQMYLLLLPIFALTVIAGQEPSYSFTNEGKIAFTSGTAHLALQFNFDDLALKGGIAKTMINHLKVCEAATKAQLPEMTILLKIVKAEFKEVEEGFEIV